MTAAAMHEATLWAIADHTADCAPCRAGRPCRVGRRLAGSVDGLWLSRVHALSGGGR